MDLLAERTLFPLQTFMTVLIKRKQLALQAQAKKQNKE